MFFAISFSEHNILIGAGLVSAFLTFAVALWPKFSGLVKMVWTDFRAAFEEVLDFVAHVRQRLRAESTRARLPDASRSLVEAPAAEYPQANRSG